MRVAEKLPHEKGGIDIEGMAGTANGSLLIGFRSPLVGGKAIIVELLNPAEVIELAEKPKFAKLQSIDLGGLGVRDMSSTANAQEVMILAGSDGTQGQFQLLTWKFGQPAAKKATVDFQAKGNWEGIARDGSSGKYIFAVDGGEAGSPKCKERKDDQRSFDFRIQ